MIEIHTANKEHIPYVSQIVSLINESAKIRGTGIAKRSPSYLEEKINQGKAIIGLDDEQLVGFCYIETWSNHKYVANSGLIVHPDYRGRGIAKQIKSKAFKTSRELFPNAKIFGITTNGSVMNINSSLGYKPVTFNQLTTDNDFWDGCKSCPNYDILQRNKREMCLCTAMLYKP